MLYNDYRKAGTDPQTQEEEVMSVDVKVRSRSPILFPFNARNYVVGKVEGNRVVAHRILKTGHPGKRTYEFSKRMVERSVNRRLKEGTYLTE